MYHFGLSLAGALIYRFPSRHIIVVGVTGTKGKSTTTEILYHIFKAAGYKVALQNTIHFIVGEKEERNLYKMTMPGRFFIQHFLRRAVSEGCQVAILEMSSEGAKQYRHKFIDLDALVFTNLSPEHIESHGSYEKYVEAKLSIAKMLVTRVGDKSSPKVLGSLRSTRLFSKTSHQLESGFFEETLLPGNAVIANQDDNESEKFFELEIENKIPYSLKDAQNIKSTNEGSSFEFGGVKFETKIPGLFNVSNMLGAIKCAKHFGVKLEDAKKGLESMNKIRGRMEKVDEGQGFEVVVDYAHTADSLRAIYSTYKDFHTICILGNTGGGRDKWKRPEMAKVADEYCSEVILTNEDPYDEDPVQIINEMKVGIKNKPLQIILDRRDAIREALERAKVLASTTADKQAVSDNKAVAVLITGKGTDPYIMGPNGSKTPWDDAKVVREELQKINF